MYSVAVAAATVVHTFTLCYMYLLFMLYLFVSQQNSQHEFIFKRVFQIYVNFSSDAVVVVVLETQPADPAQLIDVKFFSIISSKPGKLSKCTKAY